MTTDYGPLNREPRNVRPPFDVYPPEFSDSADLRAALLDAIGPDVELGDHDRRIITWLAGWDVGTVGTVASLFHRVRETDRGATAERRGSADGLVPPNLAEVIDRAPSLAELRADNAQFAAERVAQSPAPAEPRRTGWVALAGQLVGDLGHHETVYAWDSRYYGTKAAAIKAGYRLADDTDDFNVGRLEDGVLVWFGWMDEKHPDEDYPAVAEQHGWTVAAPIEPRQPRVWRVTAVPEDCEVDGVLGAVYRQQGQLWQTKADSGRWVASGWSSLAEMTAAGYTLTEVEVQR